jgi:hypothetical protein
MDTQLIPTKSKGLIAGAPATRVAPANARRQPIEEKSRSEMPEVLKGDPAAARRVIERWLERTDRSTPIRSMAAAIALQNGWLLDDATGRIVARVDVGWFLARIRSPQEKRTPSVDQKPDMLPGVAANDAHVHAA